MASDNQILEFGAKLAAMPLGKSFHERDGLVLFESDGRQCTVSASGGLCIAAVVCEHDQPCEPYRLEIKKELLSDIASAVDTFDVTLRSSDRHVVIEFGGKNRFTLLNSEACKPFPIVMPSDPFCISASAVKRAIAAIPPVKSNMEKFNLECLKIARVGESVFFYSTDGVFIYSVEFDANGAVCDYMLPTVAPAIIYAAAETGKGDQVFFSRSSGEVMIQCGIFTAYMRQTSGEYPKVQHYLDSIKSKERFQTSVPAPVLRNAFSIAAKDGFSHCNVTLKAGSPAVIGCDDPDIGTSTVSVDELTSWPGPKVEMRVSPSAVFDISKRIASCGVSDVVVEAGTESGSPIGLRAVGDGFAIKAVLALLKT